MNTKTIVWIIIVILVIIGGISLYNNTAATAPTAPVATITPSAATATTSSAASPMQSTGTPFAQYQYYSKAHEIYPTLGADTKKALGAFSYKQEDLGNGEYKFTLTNNTEGYQGSSVTVVAGQSVYFIERSSGDDTAAEDSVTTDDFLVAVDAQGNLLK